jgi:hypothetical protein
MRKILVTALTESARVRALPMARGARVLYGRGVRR